MRTGIQISYTLTAGLVIGALLFALAESNAPATGYYGWLYFGAFLGISGVAGSSLVDEFVELVEDCSAPIRWFVIVGGAIGWVILLLLLPLIGGLIIELARRVFLPSVNMTINDWLWLLFAITNGGIAAILFMPLRALFAMRPS